MNLEQGRKEIRPDEIFAYSREHARELLLPDQDILNAVFGSRTRELDDFLWNYDARNYSTYLLRSGGICDMDWVMSHTGDPPFLRQIQALAVRYTSTGSEFYISTISSLTAGCVSVLSQDQDEEAARK